MGVALLAWGRFFGPHGERVTVPAPVDRRGAPWLLDFHGGNARVLDGAGYTSWRPDLTCTFVNNPDTDTSPGQQVISNKLLAYAFLLSIEGYPFVYGKDYFPPSVCVAGRQLPEHGAAFSIDVTYLAPQIV